MRGLSHIGSVLIGGKYRNCRYTLDVYLLVAILIGQIQSKPIYKLVTYIPSSPLVMSPLSNFDLICPIQFIHNSVLHTEKNRLLSITAKKYRIKIFSN